VRPWSHRHHVHPLQLRACAAIAQWFGRIELGKDRFQRILYSLLLNFVLELFHQVEGALRIAKMIFLAISTIILLGTG
jgi:hypothetical protein